MAHTSLALTLAEIVGSYEQGIRDKRSSDPEYKYWEKRAILRIMRAEEVADLLEALEASAEVMEFAYMNAPKQPKEIEQARAAIAKAKGETE